MAPKFDTEKMQERQNFRNVWHTDLTHSIQGDTPCNQSPLSILYLFDRI